MVAENDANASSRCSVNGCLVFYSRALQLIDAYESSKSILHLKAAFAYFYKALDGCHLDCHSVAVRLAIAANLLKYTTDFSEAEMHLLKANETKCQIFDLLSSIYAQLKEKELFLMVTNQALEATSVNALDCWNFHFSMKLINFLNEQQHKQNQVAALAIQLLKQHSGHPEKYAQVYFLLVISLGEFGANSADLPVDFSADAIDACFKSAQSFAAEFPGLKVLYLIALVVALIDAANIQRATLCFEQLIISTKEQKEAVDCGFLLKLPFALSKFSCEGIFLLVDFLDVLIKRHTQPIAARELARELHAKFLELRFESFFQMTWIVKCLHATSFVAVDSVLSFDLCGIRSHGAEILIVKQAIARFYAGDASGCQENLNAFLLHTQNPKAASIARGLSVFVSLICFQDAHPLESFLLESPPSTEVISAPLLEFFKCFLEGALWFSRGEMYKAKVKFYHALKLTNGPFPNAQTKFLALFFLGIIYAETDASQASKIFANAAKLGRFLKADGFIEVIDEKLRVLSKTGK